MILFSLDNLKVTESDVLTPVAFRTVSTVFVAAAALHLHLHLITRRGLALGEHLRSVQYLQQLFLHN